MRGLFSSVSENQPYSGLEYAWLSAGWAGKLPAPSSAVGLSHSFSRPAQELTESGFCLKTEKSPAPSPKAATFSGQETRPGASIIIRSFDHLNLPSKLCADLNHLIHKTVIRSKDLNEKGQHLLIFLGICLPSCGSLLFLTVLHIYL